MRKCCRPAWWLSGLWITAAVLLALPATVLLANSPAAVAAAAAADNAADADYSFELRELFSDEDVSFADLVKDKPLVVHVWAPDCPHCLRQMPYAAALYRKLDLAAVSYVTLSITGDKPDILAYLEETELTFPTLWGEDGEPGAGYFEAGWPMTYVFAPGGAYYGQCDILGPAYLTEMRDLIKDAAESVAQGSRGSADPGAD